MKTYSASHFRGLAKSALLVSAAFPLSALVATGSARAEQTVEVNAAETAASVNAKIVVAKAAPDRDIKISVTSKGDVTSPGGPVTLVPIAGQGDGKVTFTNAGNIGAVDKAGVVTDAVGVSLGGSSTKADNTLTGTNSGLITGGFSATGFGGTVSLDNTGTIHNGVNLQGAGNVKLTSSGAVRSGAVKAQSTVTNASTTSGATTTDVYTTGDVTGVIADVASADGKTKGGASFIAPIGDSSLTANGVAGGLIGYSGGSSITVETTAAPAAAGKAVTTSENNVTYAGGTTRIVTAAASKLDSVTGLANGNVEVSVAGSVENGVTATPAGNASTKNKTVVTSDGKGGVIETAVTSSAAAVAGDSTITIAATGVVGGNAMAQATRNASISNAGEVKNSLLAIGGTGFQTTSASTTTTEDGLGGVLKVVSASSSASPVGSASVSVVDTGTVGAGISATGSKDATVTVAGSVANNVTARAGNGSSSTLGSTQVFDGKLNVLSSTSKATSAQAAGDAKVDLAQTGQVGGNVLAQASNDASAISAGKIGGGLNVIAGSGSPSYQNEETTTFDGKGNALTYSETESYDHLAGDATVTLAATSSVANAIGASATENVTISNAGVIGGGVNASSFGIDSASTYSELTPTPVVDVKAGTTTTKYTETGSGSSTATTGKLDFSNQAGGIVGFNGVGSVNLNAGGDVTVLNQGDVRGTTYAQSSGGKTTGSMSYSSTVVTDGKGGSTGTEVSSGSSSYMSTGGNVTGTYAGANGTRNFVPAANGNVTQVADRASTAIVTGAVFGDVNSMAGNAGFASSSSQYSANEATVLDVDGTGSYSATFAEKSESTPTVGGDSKVTVTGQVARSNAGGSANVYSQGTNSSTVAIGGSVADNVISNALGATAQKAEESGSIGQTITKGVYVTDKGATQSSSSSVISDGVSTVSITGKASAAQDTVGGSVIVNGVKSATATVGDKAVVGGNLYVGANNGTDTQDTVQRAYDRDSATGMATLTEATSSTSGAAAAQGNALATVAGTVEGGTQVTAGRGDATVTLTGVSQDYANAIASGSVTKVTAARAWTGTTKSGGDDFATLLGSLAGRTLDETVTTETTAVGGKATVAIDSAAALKDKAVAATGDVYAYGVGGAAVTITAGSIVGDDVEAESLAFNTVRTDKTTNDGKGTVNLSSETKTTIVGGPVSVSNAGTVGDDVRAAGATLVTVNNTGKIGDSVSASAIGMGSNSSSATTNFGKSSQQTTTETFTPVVALGKASVTNAAGAIIGGDIAVEAGEGTVTNSGTVGGTTVLGRNIDTTSMTEVRTDTSTVTTFTPAPALLTQTYKADQNGVSGGFVVRGALDNDPTGQGVTKTSNVSATINLNSGSATLGSIVGEVDAAGNRTTSTTVNMVGSGFLGADAILYPNQTWPVASDKPNPLLSLGKDAQGQFGGSNYQVRVLGVETLNKEGAGTFVINGEAYQPAQPGGSPLYTLDVGNFNIKAGEVQLTTSQYDGAEFGVRGNINNAATLVIGRRSTPGQNLFGNSLVGQTELIDGVTVRQLGNFSQTATGTTVVGITPTLVRVYRSGVADGSSLPEPLGPIGGSVYVGYLTTPQALGYTAANSRVNITGNLSLAGTVAVNVYRDNLYADGDGYTLFTYTGTGAVTATATPTLTSPYVGFTLVHDAATKQVRLEVNRSSYTSGAMNPNAKAAATGLDSALASAVTRIRTDAAGGSGFSSVTELGYAQDIGNVATALDFRLSGAQAAQLFDELSSGEIYGSLAAVDQNGVFGQTLDMLANRRSFGGEVTTQLWLNPVGMWGKFGDGDAYGASDIRSNTYGVAGGLDFAFGPGGAFGFGGAYAQHDIDARGTPESVDGSTWTIGAYLTQGFGPLYANARLAFGWTNYDVTRTMSLLARTAEASVNARQVDASLELGYDYKAGGLTVTPFGKLVLRRSSLQGFTEHGAGAFSLDVEGRKKSIFSPVLGVKVGAEMPMTETVTLRPFAKASYTFQGSLPNDVTVRYVGGGDAFVLRGVEPDSFGLVEAGFEARVAERLNLFLSGSQSFGGDNKVTGARGGVSFEF